MNSEFVARLRSERDRLSLSALDTSLLAGVSREMWNRYERAAALPNADVLLKLQGHGFDVNYILGGSRLLSESTLSDEERNLLGDYRSTDEEGRAAVSRAARMEAARMRSDPQKPFAVREPAATAVVLHDSPKSGRKKLGA